jgi:hypothetical protein
MSNQHLTLEEFLALPEGDVTYEFVNGEAVPKYKTIEWQNNSTQGHWESASIDGKHGEKTANTIDGKLDIASGFL